MGIRIITFGDEHLDDAARLSHSLYETQRKLVPALPEKYQGHDLLVPRLRELSTRNGGVAALQNGRLVGFILAQVLPSFRGHRTAYSPEWANAAAPDQQRDIHGEMYAQASARWMAAGCVTHLLTTFANERPVLDAYFWFGFGLVATDALRGLTPVPPGATSVEIRLAEQADAGDVKQMAGELQMYLTQPPILLHQDDGPNYEDVLSQIRSGRSPTWLAYQNGQAVALLGLGPANPSACNVIHDDGTVSVYRAFVREEARGSGIGTALLASAIDWARSNGLARCAVDFEPQNVRGRRFWLRHFDAICQTVLRHIRA